MKHSKLTLALFLTIVLMPLTGYAETSGQILSKDDASARFLKAATFYEEGKYQNASQEFEALIAYGFESGDIHYNLGNSKLRTGKLGEAIGSYLQAKRYLPRDGDLRANLKFARQSAKDDLPEWKPAILETVFFWHRGLSPEELGLGLLIFNAAFWLTWLLRLYRRQTEWLSWLQRSCLLALIALGTSFMLRTVVPEKRAVVLPPEVSIHASTQEKSTVLFKLHEGAELSVVDQNKDWVRVSLPDNKQGWVEARHVLVVSL